MTSVLLIEICKNRIADGRYIVLTVPKRRQAMWKYVQPVVQILAQELLFDGLLRRSGWSRRSLAHSPANQFLPPNRRTFPSSRTRKSLACVPTGISADFVKQHGSVVGLLEAAGVTLDRAGERALFVAEQLAFHQSFGQRRAIDRR